MARQRLHSFNLPTAFCLRCGYAADAATNILTSGGPKAGDLTICISCGALARFASDFSLIPTSDAEAFAHMTPQQRQVIARARVAVASLKVPPHGTKH